LRAGAGGTVFEGFHCGTGDTKNMSNVSQDSPGVAPCNERMWPDISLLVPSVKKIPANARNYIILVL